MMIDETVQVSSAQNVRPMNMITPATTLPPAVTGYRSP